MKTLREVLEDARSGKYALGHFNISDSTQFNAILTAATELKIPVLIGVSEGEKKFVGIENIVALVQAARQTGKDVFLNLDHGHSVEDCKEAIDAGFDSVMFDGSKLPVEENIEKTKEVVAYARQCGREVLVEGELGYIGSSSALLDAIPEDVESAMTTPELAERFVRETGADILAPSVGNIHGILKGSSNPALDIARVGQIAEEAGSFLVLHGGSGITDEDFRAAIAAGINIVHINSEIRLAYRKGIEAALSEDTNQIAPYKYLNRGRDAVNDVVRNRLTLFGNL